MHHEGILIDNRRETMQYREALSITDQIAALKKRIAELEPSSPTWGIKTDRVVTKEAWDKVMDCFTLLSGLGFTETAVHLSDWLTAMQDEAES